MAKIAAIQMCSTDSVDANLKKVEEFVKLCKLQQADLVVLPEMFPFCGHTLEDKLKIQEPYSNGKIQTALARIADQNDIWIVGGTIPLSTDIYTRISAACLVYDNKGQVVGRYDKMHLFDVTIGDKIYHESKSTQAGENIAIVSTPYGTLGLSVCYDIRFPELYRKMFNQGANILCVPSAFTVPTGKAHWEVLLRARAIENFSYVVASAQTGKSPDGVECYGHSMIISPWGEVLAMLADDEGIIVSEIDLNLLNGIRTKIPVKNHQKIFDIK